MKGEVVYLYAFDVANEIDIARVQDVLGARPLPFQVQTDRGLPRDLALYKPLVIEPSEPAQSLCGRPLRVLVRVYEVGVVSILMRSALECNELADLMPYHKTGLDDGASLDQLARRLCDQVCKSLAEVMKQVSRPSDPEAYTVFCLTDLGGQVDTSAWLSANRRSVAELLSEARQGGLSEVQVAETLRIQRSYSPGDLAVIDWDAALAVDLSGYLEDVLHVLELANLQLEEYRVMDEQLDRYLDGAYADLKRRRFGLLGTHTKTLSTLRLFRVDVTKLNDEVTHITKFFGDWYLARVYLGAAERFYINQWRRSVEDRLSQLDELYTVVNGDINNRRMVWLEVLVVIFFAIDLLMLAFWKR
jgi:hypothetical protein